MNLVKSFEALSAMSDVRRYSMVRLSCPENVLEHTAFVAIFCYLIAVEINNRSDTITGETYIDVAILLAKALIHDFEEIVTGDIPRPTKYHSPETRAMFSIIEDEGAERKLRELGLLVQSLSQINQTRKSSKDGREGLIVAVADTLAVVYKSWDEVLLRGNRSMMKVAASTLPDIDKLLVKAQEHFEGDAFEFITDLLDDAREIAVRASE